MKRLLTLASGRAGLRPNFTVPSPASLTKSVHR